MITNERIIKAALAALLFGFFVMLLAGPLQQWVPSCRDISFGFCVRR